MEGGREGGRGRDFMNRGMNRIRHKPSLGRLAGVT